MRVVVWALVAALVLEVHGLSRKDTEEKRYCIQTLPRYGITEITVVYLLVSQGARASRGGARGREAEEAGRGEAED